MDEKMYTVYVYLQDYSHSFDQAFVILINTSPSHTTLYAIDFLISY